MNLKFWALGVGGRKAKVTIRIRVRVRTSIRAELESELGSGLEVRVDECPAWGYVGLRSGGVVGLHFIMAFAIFAFQSFRTICGN